MTIRELVAAIAAELADIGERVSWASGTDGVEAGPTEAALVSQLPAGADQLRELYLTCRSIDLNSVGNGIFVHPLPMVLRDLGGPGPVRTEGVIEAEIIPFGSDGGGAWVGQRRPPATEVLYLPEGALHGGVYWSDSPRFAPLAADVEGFLEWVLSRCRSPEEGW